MMAQCNADHGQGHEDLGSPDESAEHDQACKDDGGRNHQSQDERLRECILEDCVVDRVPQPHLGHDTKWEGDPEELGVVSGYGHESRSCMIE